MISKIFKSALPWYHFRYFALKRDRESIFDLLQTKKQEIVKLQNVIDDNRKWANFLTITIPV